MIPHLDALAIPWVDKNNRAFGGLLMNAAIRPT